MIFCIYVWVGQKACGVGGPPTRSGVNTFPQWAWVPTPQLVRFCWLCLWTMGSPSSNAPIMSYQEFDRHVCMSSLPVFTASQSHAPYDCLLHKSLLNKKGCVGSTREVMWIAQKKRLSSLDSLDASEAWQSTDQGHWTNLLPRNQRSRDDLALAAMVTDDSDEHFCGCGIVWHHIGIQLRLTPRFVWNHSAMAMPAIQKPRPPSGAPHDASESAWSAWRSSTGTAAMQAHLRTQQTSTSTWQWRWAVNGTKLDTPYSPQKAFLTFLS